MEIAPIAGIRAVSLAGVQRVTGATMPSFAVGATARIDDESYSAGERTPDRGLEDEETSSTDEGESGAASEPEVEDVEAHLSCFA